MLKAEARLKEEHARVASYLDESTGGKIQQVNLDRPRAATSAPELVLAAPAPRQPRNASLAEPKAWLPATVSCMLGGRGAAHINAHENTHRCTARPPPRLPIV
jgi:hypothetical protein